MTFLYTPYILPLIAAAAISIFVAIYAWRRRPSTGAFALALMAISIAQWMIGYAFEISGTNLSTIYICGVSQYLGIAFAPYAWLMFAIDFAGYSKVLTRRFYLLTAIFPAVTVLLAWTTRWHALIWTKYEISFVEGFSALTTQKGYWFYAHTAYSYLMLLIGTILLARALLRSHGLYRGQVVSMLVAVLTPWVGNVLYLTGNSPIPYLDLTPFSFAVTVVALAWAIFGFHLVDIKPIARDLVIDSLQEGVVVLDANGRVADINSSAVRIFGIQASHTIGSTASEIFMPWQSLRERLHEEEDWVEEFSTGVGQAERRYEAAISHIQDAQGRNVGRVMMVRELIGDSSKRRPASTTTEPAHVSESVDSTVDVPQWMNSYPLLKTILIYFYTPIKTDLIVPPSVNPIWYLARERSFTIILRIGALVGTIAYILTLPVIRAEARFSVSSLFFGIIIAFLWFLGGIRRIKFEARANAFLILIYFMALNETVGYGFSVESFLFFTSFVIISALLIGRRGAGIASVLSFITLGVFAWIISSHIFVPINMTASTAHPQTIAVGLTNLFVFLATSLGMANATVVLMENLNSAWQKEAQVSNLLHQERDLLEHRVDERTKALQESEIRFRQIVENASDIIYRTDLNGLFTYVNPAALNMMGFKNEQEVLGKSYLDLTTPEARSRLKRVYDRQYIGQIENTYYEFPAITMKGEIIWVGQNVQLIWDDDKITGFQALARNITQLRQAQEALLIARNQALEASSFKSQLISRVSHELRTPLGGILGFAELLQEQSFGPLNESQQGAVSNVVESTKYLANTVNDLLDQSQIESKSISLHNDYFRPSDLMEKITKTMSVLAGKKGLDFHAEIAPDFPIEIYGDANRLQQIIVNLAGNAIKFTSKGSVSVRFDIPMPAWWSVKVKDTGVGIPEEECQNIFEPFRQLSNSITRENRGSGLGLAIVKQLMELMGGEISLQSEVGVGSTFTLTFPLIQRLVK